MTAIAAGSETFTPAYSSDPALGISEWDAQYLLGPSQVTYVPATILITGGQPAISVSGGGQPVADGEISPSSLNETDFGTAAYGGQPVSQTYTISNSGTGFLTLGNLALNGTNPNDFTITSPPAASVAPGGSTTLTVQFAPTALGTAHRHDQLRGERSNPVRSVQLRHPGRSVAGPVDH